VVIGINYFNQKGEMKGRVDEARNLAGYLQHVKRYRREDMILLSDDQNGPFGQPTKRNILSALFWLAQNAVQGEKLVIYYSGHGRVSVANKKSKKRTSSSTSSSSSKAKGKEPESDADDTETIYPVDFRQFKEGMIKPEELDEILKPAKDRGAKLTIIMDAHTGSK
jgi:metacaspase-1